jgi:hypothetical protein
LDSRLQKDNREARVLNTGDVAIEFSDDGVEVSELNDCAEAGRGIGSLVVSSEVRTSSSSLVTTGVRIFTS